jgi:hypothetical protein
MNLVQSNVVYTLKCPKWWHSNLKSIKERTSTAMLPHDVLSVYIKHSWHLRGSVINEYDTILD